MSTSKRQTDTKMGYGWGICRVVVVVVGGDETPERRLKAWEDIHSGEHHDWGASGDFTEDA